MTLADGMNSFQLIPDQQLLLHCCSSPATELAQPVTRLRANPPWQRAAGLLGLPFSSAGADYSDVQHEELDIKIAGGVRVILIISATSGIPEVFFQACAGKLGSAAR